MSIAQQFEDAVKARDIDAAMTLFADDVVFLSPAAHTPYAGADKVRGILTVLLETVFSDFRYVSKATGRGRWDDESPECDIEILNFLTTVGGRQADGADWFYVRDGKIVAFKVMVRPLSALGALAEAMGAQVASGTLAL
ncbi:MAG: nuclear transport factor 2 family protein [Micrococcales bacterium]|nr:nuclear transport factor 2 family protein [Micrococcales bacterium]